MLIWVSKLKIIDLNLRDGDYLLEKFSYFDKQIEMVCVCVCVRDTETETQRERLPISPGIALPPVKLLLASVPVGLAVKNPPSMQELQL